MKGLGKILGGVAGGVAGTFAGGPAGTMAGAAGGAAAGGAIEGLIGGKKKRKRGSRGGAKHKLPPPSPQKAGKPTLHKAASRQKKATLDRAMDGVERVPGGVSKRGVFTPLGAASPPMTSLTANDVRAIIRDELSNFFALYFDAEEEMTEMIEEIEGALDGADGESEF